jgi:FlaA1/EpsC-like NDP-sugar epimerase
MAATPQFVRFGKTLVDLFLLAGAFGLTFVIRFEVFVPLSYQRVFGAALPSILLLQLICLVVLGVPWMTWRYVSLRECLRLFFGLAAANALLVAWRWLATVAPLPPLPPFGSLPPVPYGVLLIDLPLAFLALVGVRVGVRLIWEWRERGRRTSNQPHCIPTLLIGAGRAGATVVKELVARPDAGIHLVGFLDDDPSKTGTRIHGIPVLGRPKDLRKLAHRHGVRQALLTTTETAGTTLWRLAQACEACGIAAKIIPEIPDIVGGKVDFARIRNVAIEDILRRPPVELDTEAIARILQGKTVLITGAGGSIGSELCEIVCRFHPRTLILVEKAENNLFHVNWKLSEKFPDVARVPCVADICDVPRMEQILAAHQPEVLLHAAAHKHVPLMEGNPGEAIKNNVLGTRCLADLADAHGVGVFVMISTDKAVRPTSVMGVSKRVAELYIQALSQRSRTRFVAVRFGNVLGSVGSVVPIFKEQIARGGPVTVTHPDMQRYFMTIPEACQLVLQAASMGRGGEIFILDMGEPVKIVDLARDLIRMSGLRPDDDIEIRFTGIRPGEKLYEELALEGEGAEKTRHPRIYVGRLETQDWEAISRLVKDLALVAESPDAAAIHATFQAIVPEYHLPALPAIENLNVRPDTGHAKRPLPASPRFKRRLSPAGDA